MNLDFQSHKRTKEQIQEQIVTEIAQAEDSYIAIIILVRDRSYPFEGTGNGEQGTGKKIGVSHNSEYCYSTIRQQTWLNDGITPYQLYLKFLYEYFKEDINLDEDDLDVYLPDSFLELAYQKQAVISACKILDAYGGVFLADVVGLGKTYISALLAQQLQGRILVICPPVLEDYWRDTFFEFGIRGYEVESLGKLEALLQRDLKKFRYVLIDEAHRFRNEDTQGYNNLFKICAGKKVILVSATPLNNRIGDIFNQLKLFQSPRKSKIPGIPNLEQFFKGLQKRLDQYAKDDPNYSITLKEVSQEIRTKVLRYVMVRRTRTEILNYYADDLNQQGLIFPKIAEPQKIIYQFDEAIAGEPLKVLSVLKKMIPMNLVGNAHPTRNYAT